MHEKLISKCIKLTNEHYEKANGLLKNWAKLDSLEYAIDMINNDGYIFNPSYKEKRLMLLQ